MKKESMHLNHSMMIKKQMAGIIEKLLIDSLEKEMIAS
jgi:hypothetical protein